MGTVFRFCQGSIESTDCTGDLRPHTINWFLLFSMYICLCLGPQKHKKRTWPISSHLNPALSQASNVCRCFPHKTIYQTQMKIRHIVKTTYISTNLSVFVRVSEEKPLHTSLLRYRNKNRAPRV